MKPFSTSTITQALTLTIIACQGAVATAQFPPTTPTSHEVTSGPAIGINVSYYYEANHQTHEIFEGVRVVRDNSRRSLYRRDASGQRRRYQFRVGSDVIMRVNSGHVESASDVLRNTRTGWNELLIYDRATGRIGTYEVWLD